MAARRPAAAGSAPGLALWLGLALVVILLDQFTKTLILGDFRFGESRMVTAFFNVVRVHNTGAAFSFLADASGWQRWFFAALGLAASGFIVWMIRSHPTQKLFCFAVTMIMGGALGNVVDNVGNTVSALGTGVQSGLGSIGTSSNPVGTTVSSTGNVVTQAGNTVDATGALVSSLGTGPLQPLSPVTSPVGGAVSQVGQAVAGAGGTLGTLVALECELVLVLPGDAPLGGDVLGRHTHVDGVEGVVQRADHHVHHLGVAHAGAPAHVQAGVGAAAHVFGTAPDGDVSVAQQDALAGRHDGLQARAAQAVHVEGRGALGAAAVDGRHARQVHVLGFGVDHMAEHHMADILALHVGAGE